MQYTPTPIAWTPPVAPLGVSVASLREAFASVPDPRRGQGRRFALPAILTLAVAAILADHLSEQAIAEWGADQDPAVKRALGVPKGVAPHQTTIQRLFRRLDPARLAAALTAYFDPPAAPGARPRGSQGVAVDGKAQRGRLPFAAHAGCPVHALTASCHDRGVVLAHEEIRGDAEKAEAELTAAPRLRARLDWRGRVLTGDALFCQRHLCTQVLAAGGDYLLVVKENQPTLHEDLRLLLDPPADHAAPLPLLDRREVATADKGHGRVERRHLVASTDLNAYLDWPGVAQVFRLERTWRERGQDKRAVHYGITSLPAATADAPRLLAHRRGHWSIENALHHVKDVTLGEDRSLVHLGSGPTIMAQLRDTALGLLRRAGPRRIAARLRHHARHPEAVLPLLGLPLP
ncbi:MAG TPA: ISAs1 family transposase [Solirubrobacteraceae bacterium]|nr:ISAs1 family transposase [Solirubrobacteraceae bacterium]